MSFQSFPLISCLLSLLLFSPGAFAQGSDRYECKWDGSHFAPYAKETGVRLAGRNNGWKTQEACVRSTISHAGADTICSWNETYSLYRITGQVMFKGFKKAKECFAFQDQFILRLKNPEKAFESLDQMPKGKLPPLFRSASRQEGQKVGFAWKDCISPEYRGHPGKNINGILTPACSPDVLYSWGSADKLAFFQNEMGSQKPWIGKFARTLFTTSSPVATFGYGPIPLRFKIRAKVRYKLYVTNGTQGQSTCAGYLKDKILTEEEVSNTIVARISLFENSFSLMEYDLCSSDVVESWSYGSRPHFDEMVLDAETRMNANQGGLADQVQGYAKISGKDQFIGSPVDQESYFTDYTEKAFYERISTLRWISELGLGGIYYGPGVPARYEGHFSTRTPIYFNPYRTFNP